MVGLMKFWMTTYSRRTIRQNSPHRAEATEVKKNLREEPGRLRHHRQDLARAAGLPQPRPPGAGAPRARPPATGHPSIHHALVLWTLLSNLQADVTGCCDTGHAPCPPPEPLCVHPVATDSRAQGLVAPHSCCLPERVLLTARPAGAVPLSLPALCLGSSSAGSLQGHVLLPGPGVSPPSLLRHKSISQSPACFLSTSGAR